MPDPVKIALLGCGDVAQRDYLPELQRLAGRVELVAVCGRTEGRARQVAAQYGGRVYTDYARMLAETDAAAVLNLTPIQLHTETTLAVLRAGKHVYTEKPLASTHADALRIMAEAERQDQVVVCAPCVRLFPQVRRAAALLEAGTIGRVCSARASGHGGVPPWIGYTSDPTPFFAAGGGPVFDMGVYPLHALTSLLGPVRRVMAMSSQVQASFVVADGPAEGQTVPMEVDDNWHLLVNFGDGRLASVDANNCSQGTLAPQLELHGLEGTIALNLLDVSAPVDVLRAGQAWEQIHLPQTGRAAGPDHLLGVEHLVDCLQHGHSPLLSLAHAAHVIEVVEKAAASAAQGAAFAVDSSF